MVMPAPRVRSKDPVQQRLRDHKRQWNSTYKDFSQKLKSFKDGINGKGNAKVGLPPSNIKEVLPGEIGSYLNQLSGEFQKLVGDAESIISEQEQYARTRRRRKPKAPRAPAVPGAPRAPAGAQPEAAPSAPTPAAPEGKVDEALSRLGAREAHFEKEAAGKLKRFWQYLSSIFSSKQFNRERLGLLSMTVDLYHDFMDFENEILTMKLDNMPNVINKYQSIKYNLAAYKASFQQIATLIASRIQNQAGEGGTKQEPNKKPENQTDNAILKIENNIHALYNAHIAKNNIMQISNMIDEYRKETDPQTKMLWTDRISESYKELYKSIYDSIQKKNGPTQINSIEDMINILKKNNINASLVNDDMVKIAHNKLTRFLKKQLAKTLSYNKTAAPRLGAVAVVEKIKTELKALIDILDKDLTSMEEVIKSTNNVEKSMAEIGKYLHILNLMYKKEYFGKSDQTLDYLLKRKVRRDLSEEVV